MQVIPVMPFVATYVLFIQTASFSSKLVRLVYRTFTSSTHSELSVNSKVSCSSWWLCPSGSLSAQYLANIFWMRWRSEYLDSINKRWKWTGPQRNISVNDVVHLWWQHNLFDDNPARSDWRLARVVEYFTDQESRTMICEASTCNFLTGYFRSNLTYLTSFYSYRFVKNCSWFLIIFLFVDHVSWKLHVLCTVHNIISRSFCFLCNIHSLLF